MKLQIKQLMNAALLAGAAVIVPLQAGAEQVSFTLLISVHWGNVVLEPGQHSFDIPLAKSWPQKIVLAANGSSVQIFPIVEEGGVESKRS